MRRFTFCSGFTSPLNITFFKKFLTYISTRRLDLSYITASAVVPTFNTIARLAMLF